MAILPVHQMIDQPDYLGSMQRGLLFGQHQRAQREERADKQTLRDLSPAILGGDPSAFAQAAAIDPDAAMKTQGAGDFQLRRLEPWIKFLEDADSQEAWMAYGIPVATQFAKGVQPTQNWTEAKNMIAQLKMKMEMAKAGGGATGGRVQSTYVDGNGNRVAIMADGTQKTLGANDTGMAQQTISVPGPDGRPQQFTFNKRTGNYEPAQLGGGSPPGQQLAPGQVPFSIDPAIPPEVQASIQASEAGGQPYSGGHIQPQGTGPFVGQSPAEKAAAEAQARAQVEIANLPQVGQLEAQNAAARVAAEERAKLDLLPSRNEIEAQGAGQTEEAKQRAQTRVELEQLLPKVRSESQKTVALIDKALNHPGRAAATGMSSLNPFNRVPGSPAMNFQVLLEQLKGGVFLQAFQSLKGGGAITQVEGQKAEQAIARLSAAQSDEEFIQALEDFRDIAAGMPSSIQQKLIAAAGPQQGGGKVARPMTEADYSALPSGALFVDPDDGKTYRKP